MNSSLKTYIHHPAQKITYTIGNSTQPNACPWRQRRITAQRRLDGDVYTTSPRQISNGTTNLLHECTAGSGPGRSQSSTRNRQKSGGRLCSRTKSPRCCNNPSRWCKISVSRSRSWRGQAEAGAERSRPGLTNFLLTGRDPPAAPPDTRSCGRTGFFLFLLNHTRI